MQQSPSLQSQIKNLSRVSWPDVFPDMKDEQTLASAFLYYADRAILADCVGAGKTVETIAALIMNRMYRGRNCFLFIGPSSGLRWWEAEIKAWTRLSCNLIKGDALTRKARIKKIPHCLFNITSYSSYLRDHQLYLQQTDHIDTLILDEASDVKNREAKTTQAVKLLANRVNSIYAITATPLQNNIVELFTLMELVDPTVFGDYPTFRARFCIDEIIPIKHRYSNGKVVTFKIPKLVGHKNIDQIPPMLVDRLIGRNRKEMGLHLGVIDFQDRYLEMGPKQKVKYLEIKNGILKARDTMKQIERLAQFTYLREVCDTAQLVDGEVSESPKLDELVRQLKGELASYKVVVFSQYEKYISIIEERLNKEGIPNRRITGKETPDAREENKQWLGIVEGQAVMLITTAGEMLWNLQAASVLICLDRLLNPQRMKQIVGRVYRRGQTKDVLVLNLFMENTVDESVLDMLIEKSKVFGQAFPHDETVLLTKETILNLLEKEGHHGSTGEIRGQGD